jgi:GLPGLI family protein
MKKYKIKALIITLVFTAQSLFAQNAHFIKSGIIEFDKTVNMYAMIKKSITKDNEAFLTPAFEAYKKNNGQFKVLKSTLTFGNNQSLFSPIEPEVTTGGGFFGDNAGATQNNVIFNDLTTGKSVTQKKVFEETFLVKDTTRKIKWKITSEFREIAGYTCRRANAIMLDSIYVVAFYTDQIPVSSGPESFSGLPGMILGVALPHENMTWFATKVTPEPVPDNKLQAPAKGKAVTNKQFIGTLTSVMKDWGEYAQIYFKTYLL